MDPTGQSPAARWGRVNVWFGLALVGVTLVLGMALAALWEFRELTGLNAFQRLQIELAHAHAGVLGLLNAIVGFGMAASALTETRARLISRLLIAGALLVPAGFLLRLLHPALVYVLPFGTLALLIALVLFLRAFPRRN
jgi:hypothetical protein